ncbi:MAG: hypothetical protein SF028_00305 [Candidatus Sumerlaeia bacterium]|nr:hypothetical protein [Candidatus Sumerlaeia bacterium]
MTISMAVVLVVLLSKGATDTEVPCVPTLANASFIVRGSIAESTNIIDYGGGMLLGDGEWLYARDADADLERYSGPCATTRATGFTTPCALVSRLFISDFDQPNSPILININRGGTVRGMYGRYNAFAFLFGLNENGWVGAGETSFEAIASSPLWTKEVTDTGKFLLTREWFHEAPYDYIRKRSQVHISTKGLVEGWTSWTFDERPTEPEPNEVRDIWWTVRFADIKMIDGYQVPTKFLVTGGTGRDVVIPQDSVPLPWYDEIKIGPKALDGLQLIVDDMESGGLEDYMAANQLTPETVEFLVETVNAEPGVPAEYRRGAWSAQDYLDECAPTKPDPAVSRKRAR